MVAAGKTQSSKITPGKKEFSREVLTIGSSGTWVLSLPPRLRDSQDELELLLARVFSGRLRSQENLELAQQLTLNWCLSECRKAGISIEDCWS